MKQFVVLLVFLVSFLGLKAQVYPVNVNITTAGQNMPYLSYYGDQNQHLNIFLLLTDFNSGAVDVRLKVKLEGPGFRFETSPTATILPSFNLQPGQPEILTGDAILPYLLEENLVQTSGNGSVNLQKLPEGSYTLCIDVIKDNINADILSTNNCKGLFINAIQPPLLNTPFNQGQVDTTTTVLSFNWTQPINYIGAPGLQVHYRWYLYEWVDTTNYNIFFTNQGLIDSTEEFITTKLLNIPFDVYLQNGYHYVWRVRAWLEDLATGQELDIITNNGYSAPYSFRYGKPVSLLENLAGGLKINLNASALGERKGKALWTIVDESPGEGVSDYTSYIIEYRRLPQAGENYPFEWNVDTVYQKNFDIYQLEPEKTYQVRVSGRLNDYQSPPSDVVEFATPARTVFACNSMNDIILPSNFQPLQNAYLGQYWQLGQFEMEIIEVNSTQVPGRFSGRGLIRHDFLNGARCFVRFTDMLVDKEFVVREGEAQAITDGAANWANNQYLNMVTPFIAGGVITSQGWLNDTTAFVVVNGDTLTYTLSDPNLPIIVHGEGNVEIQFWPDGTIVVTTYGTQPSSDSLNATANFNVQFKSVEGEEAFYDKKQYDHFAENYEVISCQGGYNYWVDNVSKNNTQTKNVIATVHADVNGYTANDVSFRIKGGATLVSTPINDTTFNVVLPSRSYSYQIYAYYDSLKLGKLNVVTLEVKERVVHLVPLQTMTLSEQSIENTLNTTFAAAQMNLDVIIDSVYSSSTFNGSTTFSNPEVDGMQHYTTQMKALRDEYIENHTIPSDDYLVFIVPSFTDQNIDGYMVRGKGLGFIKNSSTLLSFTTTLAHELGHGIGGLSHTWGDNLSKKGTTDNLLDYNGGTKLIKNQWKAINESPNVISLFDGEEDNLSITNTFNLKKISSFSLEELPVSQIATYDKFINSSGVVFKLTNQMLSKFNTVLFHEGRICGAYDNSGALWQLATVVNDFSAGFLVQNPTAAFYLDSIKSRFKYRMVAGDSINYVERRPESDLYVEDFYNCDLVGQVVVGYQNNSKVYKPVECPEPSENSPCIWTSQFYFDNVGSSAFRINRSSINCIKQISETSKQLLFDLMADKILNMSESTNQAAYQAINFTELGVEAPGYFPDVFKDGGSYDIGKALVKIFEASSNSTNLLNHIKTKIASNNYELLRAIIVDWDYSSVVYPFIQLVGKLQPNPSSVAAEQVSIFGSTFTKSILMNPYVLRSEESPENVYCSDFSAEYYTDLTSMVLSSNGKILTNKNSTEYFSISIPKTKIFASGIAVLSSPFTDQNTFSNTIQTKLFNYNGQTYSGYELLDNYIITLPTTYTFLGTQLDPLEPLSFVFTENYFELGIEKGKVYIKPAIWGLIMERAISDHYDEISNRKLQDVAMIVGGVVAAPFTGGASLTLSITTATTGVFDLCYLDRTANYQSLADYQTDESFRNAWNVIYTSVTIVDGIVAAPAVINTLVQFTKIVRESKYLLAAKRIVKEDFVNFIKGKADSGAGDFFKVGDNIAGKIVQNVKSGTNGKVAVIGRKMDGHVNDVVNSIQGQGKQVEAFSESFQFNRTFNIDGQNYSWQQIKDDFTNPINPVTGQRKYASINQQGWIADLDVPNTLMYKANQQWAQKIINDGYEIIDMGYPEGQNLGPSLFYNMELSIIFP